jgi:ABC-type glycerol-3-phosphate transport system substrate-binding protein
MTRFLKWATFLVLVAGLAGCGGGGTATPEKATPEIEAAQNQAQKQAEEDERKEFKAAKKKR